jgi:DNA-binding CsgD family transcriptional regulator
MKSFDDGRYMTLTHRGDWLSYYFSNQFYKISNYRGKSKEYRKNYLLSTSLSCGQEIVRAASDGFNIDLGITLIKRYEDACEFYLFATNKENRNGILDYYINNLDLLERFTLYFKDKAIKLLQKAEGESLILPHVATCNKEAKSHSIPGEEFFEIKRYYFANYPEAYLTHSQVMCLYWMSQGKSSSEIAVILTKAKRTIDKHIEVAKQKTNCFKITQLISFAKDHNFI